jgi:hypothetical protein
MSKTMIFVTFFILLSLFPCVLSKVFYLAIADFRFILESSHSQIFKSPDEFASTWSIDFLCNFAALKTKRIKII